MRRFVKKFNHYDQYGGWIDLCSAINEFAEKANLTIVSFSTYDHGIYVLFEEGGE